MKSFTFLALCFLLPLAADLQAQKVQEQTQAISNFLSSNKEQGRNETLQAFNNKYKGVLGSPYLYDDWYPVEITIASDKRSFPKAKYNVAEGRLMISDKGYVYLTEPVQVKSFSLRAPNGTSSFKYADYFNSDVLPRSVYLELVKYTDAEKVAIAHEKKFVKAKTAGAFNDDNYDEYFDKVRVFHYKDGQWSKLSTKRNKLSKAFPNLREKIETAFSDKELTTANRIKQIFQ